MHADRTGRSGGPRTPLPVHERIARRRKALKLAAYRLADLVDISPSYMSMIEAGTKVPAEDVAKRLAEALGDDPHLYGAWAHEARVEDLAGRASEMTLASQYRESPKLKAELLEESFPPDDSPKQSFEGEFSRVYNTLNEKLPDSARVEASPAEAATRHHPEFLAIPVLEDGADPGPDPTASDRVIDVVQLHARMLPDRPEQPFAYRPTADMIHRVYPLIHAGDLVILDATRNRVTRDTVQAVRFRGAITLSRVLHKRDQLLLVPAGDSSDFDVVDLPDPDSLSQILVGTVIVTIRNWSTHDLRRPPEEQRMLAIEQSVAPSSPLNALPRRKTGRRRDRWTLTNGRFLERDCKWSPKYGWRPNQRPEDMDFLAAHPGSMIRFRLLRDEDENLTPTTPRYFLEMTLEEWRAVLGRCYSSGNWERHGYVVAITRRHDGRYTEEFQPRWRDHVRPAPADII